MSFVIGTLNSAGTSVDGIGAIIGTETFSKGPNIVQSDAPDDNIKVLHSIGVLAPTTAHELTHRNQSDADTRDLFGSAIYEGSADFISQLADGNNVNAAEWAFGRAHDGGALAGVSKTDVQRKRGDNQQLAVQLPPRSNRRYAFYRFLARVAHRTILL